MRAVLNTSAQQQLQKLQLLFHDQLPGKMRDIEDAFRSYHAAPDNKQALDHFFRLIHNLAGSAGTFGAQQITQQALLLDKLLRPLLNQAEPAGREILDTLAEHLATARQIANQWDPKASSPLLRHEYIKKDGKDNNLIYIVEDDVLLAQQLIGELEACHYRVQHFSNTTTFLSAYKNRTPAVIIMDMVFEEGEYAGADVLQTIKQPETSLPPVIFISVRNDMQARLAAQRAGATRYFNKPIDITQLHACVDGLTNRQISDPFRVLIIDDDETLSNYYRGVMEIAGIKTQVCNNPMLALETIEDFKPELVLLDIYMPQVTGLEVAAVIRQDDRWAQTPIVFLSSESNLDKQLLAMHLGGDDFLTKPVESEHLIASVTARVKRARWVSHLNSELKFALQEIEYRQIALDQHGIVSVTDTQGAITDINHKFMEISGYSRSELIGKNHRIINSGVHPKHFFEEMWAAITHGEVWNGEICNRAKDGSLYWVESTIVPFLDSEGLPYKYIAILTNITSLMETQQALHRSEKNFRTIFNNIQDVFYQTDLEGRVTMLSPSIEKYCGYTVNEIMGQPMENFYINPSDREKVLQALHENGGVIADYEITMRNKNGKTLDVSTNSHFILNEHGDVTGVEGTVRDITERKKAQRALQVSEAHLSYLMSLSPVVIYTRSVKDNYPATHISNNVLEIFGYKPDDFLDDPNFWADHIHPDDKEKVFAELPRLFKTGSHVHEYRFRAPAGNYLWLRDELRLARDEQAQPREIIGSWVDITKTKEAQFARDRSEERLRRSQEFANIGTWDWNIQTGDLFWSDRIGPLFGYHKSIPETTYENFLNAVHPNDRDMVTSAMTACVEAGKEYNLEHRVIWDNGTIHWMLEQGDVIRDGNGVAQHMLGVVQDITGRKQLETTLREQRELLTLLRSGMSDFVATTNFQSVVEFLLVGVCKLTHSQQGFIGEVLYDEAHKPYLKTHAFTGLENTDLDNLIGPSINEGTVVIRNVPETAPRTAGLSRGHPPLKNYLGIPIYYGAELVGLYGLSNKEEGFTDEIVDFLRPFNVTYGGIIYAKRIAESEMQVKKDLVVARDEAEKANRTKSQFLSSMSHELRTPMNAILGFGQLLQMDALNLEHQDYVQEILKAGHHLLELINEVLDLSKIESGRLELSIQAVCFRDILAECRSLLSPLLHKNEISLLSDEQVCRRMYVHADAVRLKQIIINLLSNAIKYNRPQGNVRITCEPTNEGTAVRINIIDSGIGISSAAQNNLFIPFTRIDEKNHNIEGTGIGLVITRNLVHLMGGVIGVESKVNIGSTFWFTLPLANEGAVALDKVNIGEDIPTSSALTNTHKQYSILYIEDNPTNLRLVQQTLSRWPHIELLSAHEPNLGLELVKANRPDLILLDINLPGMDGYEAFRRMQTDPDSKDIPVIAVSADAMPRDIERGREAGFRDYITKPIQVTAFLIAISNALELPSDEPKTH